MPGPPLDVWLATSNAAHLTPGPAVLPRFPQAEGLEEEGGKEGGRAPGGGGAAAAVAAAVGSRLEQLDGTFLATLDGYIQGASDKGAAEVAGRWGQGCGCGSGEGGAA